MILSQAEQRFLRNIANGFISYRFHQKQHGYASPSSIQKLIRNLVAKKVLIRESKPCSLCNRPRINYIINSKNYDPKGIAGK